MPSPFHPGSPAPRVLCPSGTTSSRDPAAREWSHPRDPRYVCPDREAILEMRNFLAMADSIVAMAGRAPLGPAASPLLRVPASRGLRPPTGQASRRFPPRAVARGSLQPLAIKRRCTDGPAPARRATAPEGLALPAVTAFKVPRANRCWRRFQLTSTSDRMPS